MQPRDTLWNVHLYTLSCNFWSITSHLPLLISLYRVLIHLHCRYCLCLCPQNATSHFITCFAVYDVGTSLKSNINTADNVTFYSVLPEQNKGNAIVTGRLWNEAFGCEFCILSDCTKETECSCFGNSVANCNGVQGYCKPEVNRSSVGNRVTGLYSLIVNFHN
jgi:hypothetical protein